MFAIYIHEQTIHLKDKQVIIAEFCFLMIASFMCNILLIPFVSLCYFHSKYNVSYV